jgi:FkbH-like protein
MMMRQAFLDAFCAVLPPEPGIAVIHSSIADLAPPADFRKWDVLYALDRLIANGWTIALPAFTLSFCQGRPFHSSRSPSEVGLLADWLLASRVDARRTPHPMYSFAVAGPAADKIVNCRSTTTFGDESPFALFERENAALVMLGCGWKYCTQYHRYEEEAQVPQRFFKDFVGRADLGDGGAEHEVSATMFVRDLALNPQNDFSRAEARLRDDRLIASRPLLHAQIEAAQVVDFARICRELLANDPLTFVLNRSAVADALAKRSRSVDQPPLTVAVLGHSTVDRMKASLETELASLLSDRQAALYDSPHGQLQRSLQNEASPLWKLRPQVAIFCDRLEDLLAQPRLDGIAADTLAERVTQYADAIAGFHSANGGWSIVHRFALFDPPTADGAHLTKLVAQMNAILEERLSGFEQIVWIDTAAEAAASPSPAVDRRLWFLGRFPFAEPFSQQLARRWAGIILAILSKTARVVVLDLDNTLWSGVLGEDGLEGVQIGGDFPGNAYLALQRALKGLAARGIALAVCSKNDRDQALHAMETLPEMQIRPADLAAYRINWQPKWQNIREIAEELNLGLESVLYVDDNPVEREAVRRNLPEVKLLDLPTDPAEYADALLISPWLASAGVTAEDRKRADGYQARRQIAEERQAAASLIDFYAGLEMKLNMQPLDPGNMARAVQLSQKTNQFNTTTRRYEARDLRRIVEAGGEVVVVGLADRFSEFENIGLLVLVPDVEQPGQGVVDNYLLSCRVLGRGLETAVMHWAIGIAAAQGWTNLRGVIVETERNTPARSVFRDAGFEAGATPGEWIVRTTNAAPVPSWLTIIDRLPVA